ncbi:TaqI-like C-terminal specificity domain-containing protein [Faucicola boevrei]|uniref:TaqI-like C-terminal specificity domain-containing protein n=1 Tax=Faucicola boevrei TaxID=346665 RepID=UPI0003785E1F|nr:TaqI-like C-terminal specificity domain-containing protein [Moraxella boevrei]
MLRDWDIEINYGIKTGFNDAFIIDENTKNELIAKDNKNVELIKPILRGRDIGRYSIDYQNLYLINVHNGYKNTPRIDIENYPTLKEFLNQFYDKLEKRSDKGATPYNLRNCAYIDNFSNEKIIYQEIVQYPCFAYSTETMFCNDTGRIITGKNLKFLLAIFNSKLFFYAVKNIYGGGGLGDTGVRMKHTFFEKFVVPTILENEQTPFITLADQMLSLNQALQTACTDFLATLSEEFTNLNLTKTLKNWHETDFDTLQKELKKQKHQIPLAKRKEWRDYFTTEHQKVTNLQNQIRAIDDEINERVYKLYGLDDEEIKILQMA